MICNFCNINKSKEDFTPSTLKVHLEFPHYKIKCKECSKGKNIKERMGYIYCIKNNSFKGWLKIGITTTSVEHRLQAYQTCSPFRNYEIAFSEYIENVGAVEDEIISKLSKGNTHEWIEADISDVIAIVEEIKIRNKINIRSIYGFTL